MIFKYKFSLLIAGCFVFSSQVWSQGKGKGRIVLPPLVVKKHPKKNDTKVQSRSGVFRLPSLPQQTNPPIATSSSSNTDNMAEQIAIFKRYMKSIENDNYIGEDFYLSSIENFTDEEFSAVIARQEAFDIVFKHKNLKLLKVLLELFKERELISNSEIHSFLNAFNAIASGNESLFHSILCNINHTSCRKFFKKAAKKYFQEIYRK